MAFAAIHGETKERIRKAAQEQMTGNADITGIKYDALSNVGITIGVVTHEAGYSEIIVHYVTYRNGEFSFYQGSRFGAHQDGLRQAVDEFQRRER